MTAARGYLRDGRVAERRVAGVEAAVDLLASGVVAAADTASVELGARVELVVAARGLAEPVDADVEGVEAAGRAIDYFVLERIVLAARGATVQLAGRLREILGAPLDGPGEVRDAAVVVVERRALLVAAQVVKVRLRYFMFLIFFFFSGKGDNFKAKRLNFIFFCPYCLLCSPKRARELTENRAIPVGSPWCRSSCT